MTITMMAVAKMTIVIVSTTAVVAVKMTMIS